MQVDTYLFGKVEVSPENVIAFPNGLVGFEDLKRYMLVHEADAGDVASFTLQSLEDAAVAFQIIDPHALGYNYELALTDAENALLQSPAPEDVVVMQILSKQEDGSQKVIAPNLRAPLIINTRAKVGLHKMMETFRQNIVLTNLASNV